MSDTIREYVMVKDRFAHAKIEEVGQYKYHGDLLYTDDIYYMLNDVFKMDRLITEVSYVISFDHAKKPKGICKVGQGDASETPTPLQSIFTFLLLTGANSFILVHNHVSDMPEASKEDKQTTLQVMNMAATFSIDFIGHMIINPNGYIIEGGSTDGARAELDEDGDLVSEFEENINTDVVFNGTETADEFIEKAYNEIKKMSKKLDILEGES